MLEGFKRFALGGFALAVTSGCAPTQEQIDPKNYVDNVKIDCTEGSANWGREGRIVLDKNTLSQTFGMKEYMVGVAGYRMWVVTGQAPTKLYNLEGKLVNKSMQRETLKRGNERYEVTSTTDKLAFAVSCEK